jgi:prepilin peptidase CpaA
VIDLAFALAIAGLAAFQDLRARTLPRWLTFGAALVGPAIHTVAAWIEGGQGADLFGAAVESALGAMLCAVVPFVLLRRKVMGRGDVELCVALGALLGPSLGLGTQVFALVCALAASRFVSGRGPKAELVAPAILGAVFLATVASST